MVKAIYDNGYLEWKNWQEVKFASPDEGTIAYFDSEMRRAVGISVNEICVLEIGFGNGNFLQYARQKNWRITGTEMNLEAVGRAKDNGFEALHSSELMTLKGRKYDLIVMFDVLEHIDFNEAIELLKGLRTLLKADGKMLLRFPNGDSPLSLPLQNGDPTHVNYIGADKIRFMSAQSGLEVKAVFRQSRALQLSRPIQAILKLLMITFQAAVDKFVSWAFYGGAKTLFSSLNLVVILRHRA
jgi:2-polyprenyl-3-methyl-5-hydroxy-6-metoxy-1,4-benzoquinol methylase